MTYERDHLASRIQSSLERLAGEGADPARLADEAASVWGEIHMALTPIIGTRGVAALYGRSLYLSRAAFPFLADIEGTSPQPGADGGLSTVLSKQSSANAVAAHSLLLRTFCELLSSLIGAALVERCFTHIGDRPPGGQPAGRAPSS